MTRGVRVTIPKDCLASVGWVVVMVLLVVCCGWWWVVMSLVVWNSTSTLKVTVSLL